MSPTCPASAACRSPAALDSRVTTSTRPGTRGSPSGPYDGAFGSLDCPWNASERIIEIGRTDWYVRFAPQVAMAASCSAPFKAKYSRTSDASLCAAPVPIRLARARESATAFAISFQRRGPVARHRSATASPSARALARMTATAACW
jgi:hypothetical protein